MQSSVGAWMKYLQFEKYSDQRDSKNNSKGRSETGLSVAHFQLINSGIKNTWGAKMRKMGSMEFLWILNCTKVYVTLVHFLCSSLAVNGDEY